MSFEEFIEELKKTPRDWRFGEYYSGRGQSNAIVRDRPLWDDLRDCSITAVFANPDNPIHSRDFIPPPIDYNVIFKANDYIPPYSDLEACYIRERLLRATGLYGKEPNPEPQRNQTNES